MKMWKQFKASATALIIVIGAGSVQAADFSFTGTFDQDDDVQLFNFLVGASSTVTLRTYSYAGGTQADGNVVSAGGFDPILALFDSTGALINQNDDGSGVPADPVTSLTYDTLLSSTLAAGSYTVSVMQYDNFANRPNLSDGFAQDGAGNFTASLNGCTANIFCDAGGYSRTGEWAFDVLNVESASTPTSPVPIPASLPLLAMAVGAFGIMRRRL